MTTSLLEEGGRERGAYFTADELLATDFPPPKWAVPGLIPEGLTILGGAAKFGKSWLCLGLGLSIASGEPVLGKIPVRRGPVLVLALEDPPRRLKGRLTTLLADREPPTDLHLLTELPPMPQGVTLVQSWLEEHRDARLVVVDVLAKIRPMSRPGTNAYELDYAVMTQLKRLADYYRVAIVVVTHLRKMDATDPFDTITGSTGLTGAADTIMVVRRSRNEQGAELHVTGRDINEGEYAITFDAERCTWTLEGNALADAAEAARQRKVTSGLGDRSREILDVLAKHPAGIGPTEIGNAVGINRSVVSGYLGRLVESGRARKCGRGKYTVDNGDNGDIAGQVLAFPGVRADTTVDNGDIDDVEDSDDVTVVTGVYNDETIEDNALTCDVTGVYGDAPSGDES